MDDSIATIKERLRLAARVSTAMADQEAASIAAGADLIATTFRAGGKLLLCGNGGSAADCQHMTAELVGRLTCDMTRPGLPAIALTADTSFLTAYPNDLGFDGVFARQAQALGPRGDVLITISTSAVSPNVLAAVDEAKRVRLSIVALLGEAGTLYP